ncbi:Hypothetical protein PHPALM_8638 [Phytophthora palmivora]|uniref:Uncharacterized protein n=1 Tax=Phytophthora palmivora TaxID=4796 RepID=A0A2P4Y9B5_9STRA|nr:Hypothetical protein PHPALM_8638 [Phytophthora palmivora]
MQAHIGRLYVQIAGTASLEADNDTGKAVAKLYPLIKKLKQLSCWRRQRKHIELMRSQHKGDHKNLRNTSEATVLPRDVEEIHRAVA